MKPKEWLFQNGHMTREEADKRGRMSLANKALVENAVANGAIIDGYAVVKPKAGTIVEKSAEVKVEKTAGNVKTIADIGAPSHDEKAVMAIAVVKGKAVEVGMRTVDNLCGNSLNWCYCPNPQVNHLDSDTPVVVNFKPRN